MWIRQWNHSPSCLARHFGALNSSLLASSEKKGLRKFLQAVHPDVTSDFPDLAKKSNHEALAKLNSFFDDLEKPLETTRSAQHLTFFRRAQSVHGKEIQKKVLRFHLQLPEVPFQCDLDRRETLALDVASLLTHSINSSASLFSPEPNVDPIIPRKNFTRENLNKLFDADKEDLLRRYNMYSTVDDKEKRRAIAIDIFRKRFSNSMMKQIVKVKNKPKQKRYLEKMDRIMEKKIEEKFLHLKNTEKEEKEKEMLLYEARTRRMGLHPHLLFFHGSMSPEEKKIGLEHLWGEYCKNENEVWLLENLYRVLSQSDVVVPIALSAQDMNFSLDREKGVVRAPYKFNVWELADFLESHIDEAREIRGKLLFNQNEGNRLLLDEGVNNAAEVGENNNLTDYVKMEFEAIENTNVDG